MSGSSKSNPSTSELSTSDMAVSKSSTHEHIDFTTNLVTMLDIVKKAQDVAIDMNYLKNETQKMVQFILSTIKEGKFKIMSMSSVKLYMALKDVDLENIGTNAIVDWLFVLNALNFALWNPKDFKQWTVCGQTGYKALSSAIKRAHNEGKPIWNPNYYSKITQSEVEVIFRSDDDETNIPLIEERVKTLHEIGRVLLDKYEGTFLNCIETCEDSASKLLQLLFKEFESYRDKVIYDGKEVYIGCKAVTLISDLKYFKQINIDKHYISTMFVDYCAPRLLLKWGILSYSDRLVTRFEESDEPLEHGSREEVEIRCCSLIACKRWCYEILKELNNYIKEEHELSMIKSQMPFFLDNVLWVQRHLRDDFETVPFHNIRSVYY